MAMTRDDALRKVVDLLNLAEGRGTNSNEAAVAAAQAEAIMERYQLERASIEAERGDPLSLSAEEIKEFAGEQSLFRGNKLPIWRLSLACGLSDQLGCRILVNRLRTGRRQSRSEVTVIGRPSDVAVFRYVFGFAEREIERLAKRSSRSGVVRGATELNNYRHGAVRAVVETVREQKKLTRAGFVAEHGDRGQQALVRLDQSVEALDRWLRSRHPKLHSYRSGRALADREAGLAGYRDGKRISVHAGIGGASTSARQLERGS